MLSLSQYNQYKQGKDVSNIITSSCLFPHKISIPDSLGKLQTRYVPCRNCIRCFDDLREQWVSRMCLHSLCYKHCYFVTLTYGSYDLYQYEKHPFKESWLQTCPRKTSHNTSGLPKYAPTLLRQEHLTNFLKRLRKSLGFPITYCAAGEYGEKYLRPHFHIIIWSDEIITYDNICSAWSYLCYAKDKTNTLRATYTQNTDKQFRFLIGRVDFHDLVANGTLDFDSETNYKQLSSKHVFSYVAKYVAKRNNVDKRLYNHILTAYYHFDAVQPYIEKDDINNCLNSIQNEQNRADFFGFDRNMKNTLLSDYVDDDGTLCITLKHNQKIYEKVTKNQFVKIFSPFFVSSRAVAIGRKYYDQNFERFQAKCFDLPKFHNKQLVFPAYFLRLLQKNDYPIHFAKVSTLCRSYSLDFIPYVRDYYLQFMYERTLYMLPINSVLPSRKNTHKFTKDAYLSPTFICNDGYITYHYSPGNDAFEGYKYSRQTKTYELYDVCERVKFCAYIIELTNKKIDNLKQYQEVTKLLNDFNHELLINEQRTDIVDSFIQRREERSKIYKLTKNQFSKL